MKKLLFSILVAMPFIIKAQKEVVFSQNFNASTTLKDYILSSNTTAGGTSGGPIADNNTARFDSFGQFYSNLPANTVYSIDGDGLKVTKNAGSVAVATAQIKGLTYASQLIFAQFDLDVNSASAAQTSYTVIACYFGQNFPSNNNSDFSPGTDYIYQTLNIKLPTDGSVTPTNNFNFTWSSSGTSAAFSGKKTITWVVNRTSASVTYIGVDGSTKTLGSGLYHIWVGSTLVNTTSSYGPSKASNTATDFRIRVAGTWVGHVAIDNLTLGSLPTDGTGTLPVALTNFTAKAQSNAVNLTWKTATESNFSHFDVTRSADGQDFAKIGERAAQGASTYNYTDFTPAKGINYYQLISQDKDGKSEKSEVVSAKVASPDVDLNITGTSASAVDLSIYSEKGGSAKITLTNVNGQVVAKSTLVLNKGYNKASLATAYTGLLIVAATTPDGIVSKKIIK